MARGMRRAPSTRAGVRRTVLNGMICALIYGLAVVFLVVPAHAQTAARATAISIDASNPSQTLVSVSLSASVTVRVFTLPAPDRAVVDVRGLAFAFAPGSDQVSGGMVRAFRYGLVAPGRSRMVFDLNAPVAMDARVEQVDGRWVLRLVLSADGVDTSEPSLSLRPGRYESSRKQRAKVRAKPVIVLDPGHGGLDPGAIAPGGLLEKSIVLSVARRVRDAVLKTNRFEVVMTRASDRFLSLDERAEVARKANAALFISLHADAIANIRAAATVRGATVYTLGENASDRHAQELAEKENAADRFGRVKATEARGAHEVRSILFDLVRRESANRSAQFREHLIKSLKGRVGLSRSPRRSAAFRVLKQLETPSVLVELGYMSNAKDRALMRTKKWQRTFAGSVAKAISAHFGKGAKGR